MKMDWEYFRFIAVSAFSPILAYFHTDKGFFYRFGCDVCF